MKNIILLFAMVMPFISMAQCDGDIYATFNVAEEPGYDPNTHFMWGKAVHLLDDHWDCKDQMEEYDGGGQAQLRLYTWSMSGGVSVPANANINGQSWNLHNGTYNSGYDLWSQWVAIDGIAEYVKANYPNYLDNLGRFWCEIWVPIRKSGLNNQYTYYHLYLGIWTDYRVKQIGQNWSCEGDQVDFNTKYESPFGTLINQNVTALSPPYTPTSTNGVYNTGNIGTSLTDTAWFNVSGSYIIPTENMNPNDWPFAPQMLQCFYDFNGGSWAQTSLGEIKTLYIDKTFKYIAYNMPTAVQSSGYPSPMYDNDPSINLNSYWGAEGYTGYQWSGGGVTYNSGTNQYWFSPSVGAGVHQVTLSLNNNDKCYNEITSNIPVTQYPGTPNKPRINYIASFDYSSDSAISTGSCLAPTFYDFSTGTTYTDLSFYERHKYLCPKSTEDSIELFILSPSASLTYEWKINVDGLEQTLGGGVSKKVRRLQNPLPNTGTRYKETVYFRSKNIVNNYSPWEYVVLDYPVIVYDTINPNSTTSLYYLDTVCHNGNINYAVANQYLTNSAYLGESYQNVSNPTYYLKYNYTDWNSNSNSLYSGNFTYDWNSPNKLDTFRIVENGVMRSPLSTCWVNWDYCDCEVRTLDVLAVKSPEITNVNLSSTNLTVGEYVQLSATVQYQGTPWFYFDTLSYPYVGNNVWATVIGDTGVRNLYVHAVDNYGCYDDSTFNNLFHVNGYVFSYDPFVDSIMGNSVPVINCLNYDNANNYIITPNSDGINDVLEVCETRHYEIVIIDRWGNVVMELKDESLVNMNDLAKATYYYRLKIESLDDKQGFIEIVK